MRIFTYICRINFPSVVFQLWAVTDPYGRCVQLLDKRQVNFTPFFLSFPIYKPFESIRYWKQNIFSLKRLQNLILSYPDYSSKRRILIKKTSKYEICTSATYAPLNSTSYLTLHLISVDKTKTFLNLEPYTRYRKALFEQFQRESPKVKRKHRNRTRGGKNHLIRCPVSGSRPLTLPTTTTTRLGNKYTIIRLLRLSIVMTFHRN